MTDQVGQGSVRGEPKARAAGPVEQQDRIESLDVLRGFALFGVLLVNLEYWFRSTPQRYQLSAHPFPGRLNWAVDVGLEIFFDNKFISLFSMLFGVGLAVQMARADARGARFWTFALRRFGVLLLLGAAHIVLLWGGDILHVYAIVGLPMLLLLRRKPRTILIVFLILLFILPIGGSMIVALVQILRHAPPPPLPSADPAALEEARAKVEAAVRAYRDGSTLEIARYRFVEYVELLRTLPRIAVQAFGMFLLGLAAWKKGIVQRPSEHLALLRRVLIVGGGLGLAFSLVGLVPREALRTSELFWGMVALRGTIPGASAALSAAYAAAILLLLERPAIRARLSALGSPGRMALTNYLMQSVICSLIFFSYGLRLYDRIGPAAGAAIAMGIYALQLLFSRWWLRRYRFGPAEWLWRSLTYGKAQPMRV